MTLILHQAHGSTFVLRLDERDMANVDLAIDQIVEWAAHRLDGFDSEDAEEMTHHVLSAREERP